MHILNCRGSNVIDVVKGVPRTVLARVVKILKMQSMVTKEQEMTGHNIIFFSFQFCLIPITATLVLKKKQRFIFFNYLHKVQSIHEVPVLFTCMYIMVYASSEVSDESAHPRILVRTFATRTHKVKK